METPSIQSVIQDLSPDQRDTLQRVAETLLALTQNSTKIKTRQIHTCGFPIGQVATTVKTLIQIGILGHEEEQQRPVDREQCQALITLLAAIAS